MNSWTALILFLGAAALKSSSALEAYISYSNATCIDEATIDGTYTLSYDDENYEGFSVDYEGYCMYFEGGFLDLNGDDEEDGDDGINFDPSDYISYGVCIDCNGVVGCSSDGTCDNLMQMSYAGAEVEQSNAYESTENSDTTASGRSSVQSDPIMTFTQSMMHVVNDSQVSRESIGQYYVFGGLMCVATLLSVVAVAEKKRQRRTNALVELSDNLNSAEEAVVRV